MVEQRWQSDPDTRQIVELIVHYRRACRIVVGTPHLGGDDLGTTGELVELLARAEAFESPWEELADVRTRQLVQQHLVTWLSRRSRRHATA